jgi:penicillin-binding protein 1A
MAGAFATFAGNGVRREERTFTKVYNSDGELIIDNVQDQEQILGAKAVNYMNYCLVKATEGGTGTEADFSGMQVGGKTGSTSEFKDRWYCGFTGYYTAAVWTGFDTPEVIRPTTCNNPAAVLFRRVMKPLHSDLKNKKLYDTSGMVSVSVCLDSGLRATSACSKDARGISRVASAKCYPEDVPSGSCNKHVSVSLCSGGGKPTEWCEKFAAVDPTVKISKSSYVRYTKEEYNAAAKAVGKGLSKAYISKVSVKSGTDKDCEVHTKKAWKEYLASQTEATKAPEETKKPKPTKPKE